MAKELRKGVVGMTAKPNYSWDWHNGMHIGYTPERIRVEGRGGAVEYVPDAGTCRNLATKQAESLERIADELEAAEGWCDQNGRYATGIVSISESKLREWSDRIRKLAKEGDGHGTD